jgi:hypothetical protein
MSQAAPDWGGRWVVFAGERDVRSRLRVGMHGACRCGCFGRLQEGGESVLGSGYSHGPG